MRAYASSEILSNDDITPSNRETEKEKSQSDGGPVPLRTFEINDILHNTRSFRSNKIDTSKYNIITFIPKNLIEQFSKLANIYFLLMMILQVNIYFWFNDFSGRPSLKFQLLMANLPFYCP